MSFSVRLPMSERYAASTGRWKQTPIERTSSAIRCCSSGVPAAFAELGQAVGEMALFSKKKRTATVTAGGPVEALRIPAERFHDFLLQNPSVAVGILEQVVERLREVQDRVEAWYG